MQVICLMDLFGNDVNGGYCVKTVYVGRMED